MVALLHPEGAAAATPTATGTSTIDIADVTASAAYPCIPSCSTGFVGLSSGDVSGVMNSGNTPFTVTWPVSGATANLSGSGNVSGICPPNGVAVLGGGIDGTITIGGAELVYGGNVFTASVVAKFSGSWEADVFVPAVYEIDISGGPAAIVLTPTGVGAVAMTPTPPIAGCSGTQSYILSGTMLTAG
jgi:hypothetical protein